ncbi:MAG: quinol:cytochrome C oxidoreductase [Bacteroidota bacterium]
MDTRVTVSKRFQYAAIALIVLGAAVMAYGFITHPERAWANLLLNNYYFLSLSVGASFFLALQHISQSGWSSMFKRVPEAMMAFIPYAGVIMLLLYFGMHSLYHWTHEEALAGDALIQHKAPYLNIPFFFARLVLFFIVWTVMTRLLRRASLNEDKIGGMQNFEKSELLSKIHIFLLAITFSFATFDWIMSIDVHWFSTIFSLRNFVAAFFHGTAVMVLIIIILHQKGYYPALNKSHLLDFSRYIFMLCIVWGYFTFSQFMLIWYANIPEETAYFAERWHSGFKIIFYVNFFINWFLPFTLMLSQVTNKNIHVVKALAIILIAGQYIDLYEQIFPAILHAPVFGLIEVGFFAGFAGLFALVFGKALAGADLIPHNHPYLEESLHHHLH